MSSDSSKKNPDKRPTTSGPDPLASEGMLDLSKAFALDGPPEQWKSTFDSCLSRNAPPGCGIKVEPNKEMDMGPKIEMRTGTLKGMGREIGCMVGIPVGDYSHNPRPSIQNAPLDLPEGEYVFTHKSGSILFKKDGRLWSAED
jgi:hypothetical protein